MPNQDNSKSKSPFVQLGMFDVELSENILQLQSIPSEKAEPNFDASIRRITHENETWFSLVDVMAHFTDLETRPDILWKRTRERLKESGFQPDQNVIKLRLEAKDGKQRQTDCATGQTVMRIVQSIPSEKAEPIREWLAELGYERLQEAATPGLGIDRAIERDIQYLMKHGLSRQEAIQWIDTRIKQKHSNLAIKDIWKLHGAVGYDYATLSNQVMLEAVGKTATQLKRELAVSNPRDHLSAAENAAVSLVEHAASLLHVGRDSQGVDQLTDDIQDGGTMIDRQAIERAFSKRRPM